MFYELKTTSSMAKIRDTDAAVVSLMDVFGKEYLTQEAENPILLCEIDRDDVFGESGVKYIPNEKPRILYKNDKRLSAILKCGKTMVSASYTVDEDGLGVTFMPDSAENIGVKINLKSFSHSGDGKDYRIVLSDENHTAISFEGDSGVSYAKAEKLSDMTLEISSRFNGHGAEFKLSGEYNVYARADGNELCVALLPTDDSEQVMFKLNLV